MNTPIILLRDFNRKSIPDVLTLAREVQDGSIFSNHAKYSTPPVTEIILGEQITDLQNKYDAARNRDTIAVAQQDLAEKILLQSLSKLARYAAPIAYNDEAEIELTGFDASSGATHDAQQPGQLLFAPEALAGGGVRINLGAKGGVDAFTVIIVQEGDNVSINTGGDCISIEGRCYIHTDTHTKMTITSLPRKTSVIVYAVGTNAAGTGPLSGGMNVVTQ